MKKVYKISIGGESEGSCLRELTDAEADLIRGILDECESEYVGGYIEEAPRKYVVEVWEEINEIYTKHPNRIAMCGYKFVSNTDAKYKYPSYLNSKKYYYFFDTKEEAKTFCETEANRLICKIINSEYNETI